MRGVRLVGNEDGGLRQLTRSGENGGTQLLLRRPLCGLKSQGGSQSTTGKRHYNFVDLWRPGVPSSEGSDKTYIAEVPIVLEFPMLFSDTCPMDPSVG